MLSRLRWGCVFSFAMLTANLALGQTPVPIPTPPLTPPLPPPPAPRSTPPLPVPLGEFPQIFPNPPPNPPAPPAGPKRYVFKIDPQTPARDLLPSYKQSTQYAGPLNEDMARVTEIMLHDPMAKNQTSDKSAEGIAHLIANINHLNKKEADGFLKEVIAQRDDVRGLPFRMGDECRTPAEQARRFNTSSQQAQVVLAHLTQIESQIATGNLGLIEFSNRNHTLLSNTGFLEFLAVRDNQQPSVAALMQVYMPESTLKRIWLANTLAMISHIDATRALARLAVFDQHADVRKAAIHGLKTRRERDYTEILTAGLSYPLPAVAKNAADAIVKLERKDLLETLLDALERGDPRAPHDELVDGKTVPVSRELARVNHHRNCLLCHAPANTDDVPTGVLTVAVPLPNEKLPIATPQYYQSNSSSPDILVRIDTTYLRQDFSLMMPVADAAPWPTMQRFDFFVRTRTLTADEAKERRAAFDLREPGRLSPYHRAALGALRELTGLDTEPNAAAWRRLLNKPRPGEPGIAPTGD